MSRLDDELRVAFRREEPPADFTARVLGQIARAPAPRPGLWQRLAAFFQAPRLSWAAAGVAAALLVAVAALWLGLPGRAPAGRPDVAKKEDVRPSVTPPDTPRVVTPGPPAQPDDLQATANAGRKGVRATPRQRLVARNDRPQVSPEAQAAKERVMFALQIASSTLKDAQRMIQDDDAHPRPEPERNR